MHTESFTLRFVVEQLNLATKEMSDGDMLMARERLALVVAALDKITYG